MIADVPHPEGPKPPWLKSPIPAGERYFKLRRQLAERGLATICQSGRCPNISECWNNRHATFLILGTVCTRTCRFCSVEKGHPLPVEAGEADAVLEMAELMDLRYAVITSVTRDDLPDGGSGHFATVIARLKTARPALKIEVLIPDFCGDHAALERVIDAGPDVIAHNLEAVRSVFPLLGRPDGRYGQSLAVLRYLADHGSQPVKSGLMVGLGEGEAEIEQTMDDLLRAGVRLLTIGQYLRPTRHHVPVTRYYPPAEFAALKEKALALGFAACEAGHFVRSSYHSAQMYQSVTHEVPGL